MRTKLVLVLALTLASPAYAETDWKQVDQIDKLAEGLKAALDNVATAKS